MERKVDLAVHEEYIGGIVVIGLVLVLDLVVHEVNVVVHPMVSLELLMESASR